MSLFRPLVLLLLLGCNASAVLAAPALSIYVSIPPQKYFVEQLGGERVLVRVLVQPGQSPHTFEPTARQLAGLAQADLYYRIGIDFERALLPRIHALAPQLPILDARGGIKMRQIEGDGDGHDGDDPHIWLDPERVEQMLEPLLAQLIGLDPAHGAEYRQRHARLLQRLQQLRLDISKRLGGLERRQFMVFHPSWGYFADAFGLEQLPIEVSGHAPGARALRKVIDSARQQRLRVIFVQPQQATGQAAAVAAEIGARLVPLDPLAEDYVDNIERAAAAIAAQAEDG